ncbi:MAG TPA: zinc ribbon domain-containing protein [Gemmatimonadales bacterium]|nr:zinc ribbon domain-containing protein [Gemmatimonadales bacterium]
MPIYAYRCAGCGADFEKLVRNGAVVSCPDCEGRKLERRMSVPARSGSSTKGADFTSLGPPAGGGCCGGSCHSHHH